jgi:signal transduction histidine kinase
MSSASDDLATLICDVRHDTNNSLQVIIGALELLLGRQDLPEAVVSKLKLVEIEAVKIRECIARTSFITSPKRRGS